jgi:NagD protein
MKRGFLIDMDGVVYRGAETVPGAIEFIKHLLKNDHPFLFLTNNSQRTRRDIVTRLRRLGFPVEEAHVFTSAVATAQFVAHQKPAGTAYVIGEGGLLNALHHRNFSIVDSDPDYVIIGEGRTMTLETLENAVRMIMDGAKLIATNLDPNCPTANGIRPGCGAIVKMLETATGATALACGKPSPIMFRAARKELDLRTEETVMIGDTMETDILGGVQMGYTTVLVLSGGSKAEDLVRFSYRPDHIFQSVADLLLEENFKNVAFTGEKISK